MERIYTDVIHSYTACPATIDAEIFHATLDMNLSIELAVFHAVFKLAGIYIVKMIYIVHG